MRLIKLLIHKKCDMVSEATNALMREHLEHYDEAGIYLIKESLEKVFDLVLRSVSERDMVPLLVNVERMAREQFAAGFRLHEIQMAYNALEEVVWKEIARELHPSDFTEAFIWVSTAFEEAKDTLAVTYVALTGQKKTFVRPL